MAAAADAFGQKTWISSQIAIQISLALDNALAYGRLNASAARLEEERLYLEAEIESEYNFEDIVGKSAAIRKVLDQVAIVAPTRSTVLLHGETGTGKELFARAIHNLSPRRARTFVRLNCAAIPSGLVESGVRAWCLHRSADPEARPLQFVIGLCSSMKWRYYDGLRPKLLRALQERGSNALEAQRRFRWMFA